MLSRVCHLTRRFVEEEWGGIESSVFNLSKGLNARGVASAIYTTSMLSQPGRTSMQGVDIERFTYRFPWFGLNASEVNQMERKGGSPLSMSMLKALLQTQELSLIHTHVQNRLGGIARAVAKWRNIPYVVSLHGGWETLSESQSRAMMTPFEGKTEWGKAFGWMLGSRKVLSDADAIICVGRDEYDKIIERFPDKRVHYVPNGVDCTLFESADPKLFREKMGFDSTESYLLNVSRIDPQKDQELLIKAFAELRPSQPQLHLVLIGPVSVPRYLTQLKRLIEDLSLENRVHIIEGLRPEDPLLASSYRGAQSFILPSAHEPFGIVILEAWAAGIPVVAANTGGIRGFTKDTRNCLLFTPGDKRCLLEKIQSILQCKDRAQELVAGGREELLQYTWDQVTEHTLQIYKEVCGERK